MSATETIPTPDDLIDRVRRALTEMGWGGANIEWRGGFHDDGWPLIWCHSWLVPVAVWWAACEVAALPSRRACWPCYLQSCRAPRPSDFAPFTDETSARCRDGDCSHPDLPRWPDRSLLVRGSLVRAS